MNIKLFAEQDDIMNEQKQQSNNRTNIFCNFLKVSGIPTVGDVGSLEHAALQWIGSLRKNYKNLLASDLKIIRSYGLFDQIFVDQEKNDKIDELEKQIIQLADQLRTIKGSVPTIPKISVDPIEKQTSSNQERFIASYRRNKIKYRHKLFEAICDSKDQGLTKKDMHVVLGGHSNKEILEEIINFLVDKNQICMNSYETKKSNGGKKIICRWTSVDAKKDYENEDNTIWAKNVKPFSKTITEQELIGYAKIKSIKNGLITEYGIENYRIYPSGAIKYYLRLRNKQGILSHAFLRWNTAKDLIEIKLKPEFNFGN